MNRKDYQNKDNNALDKPGGGTTASSVTQDKLVMYLTLPTL